MTSTPELRLDHYNVRTLRLVETVRFYQEVIGLRAGPLPSGRPGAWMHDGSGRPVVHITGAEAGDAAAQAALEAHLGARDAASLLGSGAIDHVAFEATQFDAFRARLQAQQVTYREREVPQMALRQLFVEDPNGITVELNFRAAAGDAAKNPR